MSPRGNECKNLLDVSTFYFPLKLFPGRSCFLTPLLKSLNRTATIGSNQNSKAVAVHPLPMEDDKWLDEKPVTGVGSESSNGSRSSPLTETQDQPFPEPAFKRRKPHRRKHHQNQEPCLMRGVYFKNMKWQAAIKVDKKQIHLGTAGSQAESVHLFDRAAFMYGREPNFELAEEEKRQLRKLNWDEFLALTRHSITNNKQRRITGAGSEKNFEPVVENGDWDRDEGGNASSSSDYNVHGRDIIILDDIEHQCSMNILTQSEFRITESKFRVYIIEELRMQEAEV